MLKTLQTAVFEKQPPVSIHGGLMCVRIYVPVLLYCASPCLALLQFGIPNQRLFKSMTAPAGKMKAVIFSPPPSIILAFFVHYMSLQGAASSYLCPVAGYMCTEGTNLCGRRISTKKASYFTSVSLQAS